MVVWLRNLSVIYCEFENQVSINYIKNSQKRMFHIYIVSFKVIDYILVTSFTLQTDLLTAIIIYGANLVGAN